MAAIASRGGLRASDADREQVIDALKVAFVQGLLAKDVFAWRVGQALAARTYVELAVMRTGLPVLSPEPAVGVFTTAGTCPGRF